MAELFTLAVFALALNIDAMAAGVAYGVRGIKVPPVSIIILSAVSVAAIIISMTAGNMVAGLISTGLARRIGGIVLLAIGLWIFCQSLMKKTVPPDAPPAGSPPPKTVLQIRIKNMGLVIKILREPHRADLDRSGAISYGEAFLLGAALAMDSLGAGFAVSMLGFKILATSLVVGLGHITMIYLGLFMGRIAGGTNLCRHMVTLPGCLLIALGLYKIC